MNIQVIQHPLRVTSPDITGTASVRFPFEPFMAMEATTAIQLAAHGAIADAKQKGWDEREPFERHGAVAVVRVSGPLLQRAGYCWDGYDAIAKRFTAAMTDPSVHAVKLHLSSGGGVVAGCFEGVRAMRRLKAEVGKPVFAFADEWAYSAAYALACVADEIYLPRPGGVGSVGVIGTLMDWSALNAEMGLRVVVITSGAQKADGHPDMPLSQEVIDRAQARINDLGGQFAELVGEARQMTREQVLRLEAACLYGEDAVRAGLANGVASYAEVLALAAAAAERHAGAGSQEPRTRSAPATPRVQAAGDLSPARIEPFAAASRSGSPTPSEPPPAVDMKAREEWAEQFSAVVRRVAQLAADQPGLAPRVREVSAGLARWSGESMLAMAASAGPTAAAGTGARVKAASFQDVLASSRESDWVLSTEAIDRHQECVRLDWDLKDYLANPVVLFAHDTNGLPIGRMPRVGVERAALRGRVKFATAKANPLAELVYQCVCEDMLRAGSTQFISGRIVRERVDGQLVDALYANKLIEFSILPVGSNPAALREVEGRVLKTLGLGSSRTTVDLNPNPHRKNMPIPNQQLTAGEAKDLAERGCTTTTCPSCEAPFRLEAAEVRVHVDGIEARARAAEDKAAAAEKAAADAKERADRAIADKATAEKAAAEEKTRADVAVREKTTLELQPLVERGMPPAERDDLAELAAENPTLYGRQLKRAQERYGAAKPADGAAQQAQVSGGDTPVGQAPPLTRAADPTPRLAADAATAGASLEEEIRRRAQSKPAVS